MMEAGTACTAGSSLNLLRGAVASGEPVAGGTLSGKSSPVSEGEIKALFHLLRLNGDRDAREKLLLTHAFLVERLVRRFRAISHREPVEDLLQVGYIGLLKAIDRYDPRRGVKFSTFATHEITGELRHYLRDRSSTLKPPRWLLMLNAHFSRSVEILCQRLERFPTIVEIAGEMNITREGVLEILRYNALLSCTSLEEEGEGRCRSDSMRPPGRIRAQRYETLALPIEDKIVLSQALETLQIFHRRVIYLFFYHDLTQHEIGEQLGMSQRKVSRVIGEALKQLREILTKELW